MIVITTPTGQIGSKVLAALSDGDEPIRVIARDPSKLPAGIVEKVEVITGSHGDAATIDAALTGADALFWNVPSSFTAPDIYAEYVDFTRPAAAGIRRHGVTHVVAVSALGRGYNGRSGLVSASIEMTSLLDSTGAATRALANPGFMDNFLRDVASIRDQGTFFATFDPDFQMPHAATADIASTAVALLSDRSWGGHADAPVLGPEDLSFGEVATILSEALGKEVRYVQVSLEDLRRTMLGRGASEAFVDGMVAMMAAKQDGLDKIAVRTPENATPTSFRQWATEVLKPAIES